MKKVIVQYIKNIHLPFSLLGRKVPNELTCVIAGCSSNAPVRCTRDFIILYLMATYESSI